MSARRTSTFSGLLSGNPDRVEDFDPATGQAHRASVLTLAEELGDTCQLTDRFLGHWDRDLAAVEAVRADQLEESPPEPLVARKLERLDVRIREPALETSALRWGHATVLRVGSIRPGQRHIIGDCAVASVPPR